MRKLLLIINPAAGMAKKKPRVFRIADWFRSKGFAVAVMTTSKKGDAEDFVRRYAEQNDAVICCGGDGTLNEVISGLMHFGSQKPVGYLPAGTTNDMARTLHLPSNLKKAARVVISERPVPQDVGSFNETQYFTYIASFGAFTQVSYGTPQWLKNIFGHFAYVLGGLRSVGEIRPCRIRVFRNGSGDGEEGDFIFGSVSNSSSIGGVLHLESSQVSLNDGEFEVLLIRNPPNLIEFQKMLHDLRRRNFENSLIEFFHTSTIRLVFDQPTDWTLDGEYAGKAQEVEIKNLHGAVSVIRREKQPPRRPGGA